MHHSRNRCLVAFLVGAGLCSIAGCSYLSNRYHDALDMVDIGLTLTKKPTFAAFKACTGLACVGYGDIDGYFIGLGGGRFGTSRYISKSVGYGLWGKQKNVLKEADDDSADSGEYEETGLVAAVEGKSRSAACVQQLHLGWTGVVFNIKWREILDFFVGWTTADICHDDGVERRGWFADKKDHTVVAREDTPAAAGKAPDTKPVSPSAVALAPASGTGRSPRTVAPARLIRDVDASVPKPSAREASSRVRSRREESPVKPAPDHTVVSDPVPRPAVSAVGRTAVATPAAVVPASGESSPVLVASVLPSAPCTYVVRAGDVGLMQIARVQLGDVKQWRKIAELNGLAPPYVIRAGDVLRLPVHEGSTGQPHHAAIVQSGP